MCRSVLNTATCGSIDCIATIVILGTFILSLASFIMNIYIAANVSDHCLSEGDIKHWISDHLEKRNDILKESYTSLDSPHVSEISSESPSKDVKS